MQFFSENLVFKTFYYNNKKKSFENNRKSNKIIHCVDLFLFSGSLEDKIWAFLTYFNLVLRNKGNFMNLCSKTFYILNFQEFLFLHDKI